jgi:hypothetical protein
MVTYSVESVKKVEKCYMCGEPATVRLVADYPDESGYTDDVPLCEQCAEEREV